jgi:uncharacterized protein YegL
MGQFDFGGEQPINYERKCPCLLVLDVSTSMDGPPGAPPPTPIQELNSGLLSFQEAVQRDTVALSRIEISIITFSTTVRVIQTPAAADEIEMPTLATEGSTKLVDGVREALRLAEARKEWYKAKGLDYYRPYIILITDGEPDPNQDVVGLAREIREKVDSKGCVFWAFGTQNARMDILTQISHPSAPPQKFSDARFTEFFKWLSSSFTKIVKSREGTKIDLRPDDPSLFQHEV